MSSFLNGAFANERAAAVAVTDGSTTPPTAPPTPGTGDEVSSSRDARVAAIVLVIVGIVLAILLKEKDAPFKPAEGFALFTGFYIAAQAIERLLELLPAGLGSKQAKANRAVVFPAI